MKVGRVLCEEKGGVKGLEGMVCFKPWHGHAAHTRVDRTSDILSRSLVAHRVPDKLLENGPAKSKAQRRGEMRWKGACSSMCIMLKGK